MNPRLLQIIFGLVLMALLSGCGIFKPPIKFAPDGDIVHKAVALEINTMEQRISDRLQTTRPKLEIGEIAVKAIEPIYIDNLPVYHLKGTYNLKLELPRQQVRQKDNSFDIYLQRQVEGKTWRLLRREVSSGESEPQWLSYSLPEK